MMSTVTASPNRPNSGLTWGKALKAVAMVAAVVVVGVAVASLVGAVINPAIFSALTSDATVSTLTGTAIQGFTAAVHWTLNSATLMGTHIASAFSAIPGVLNITSNSMVTPIIAENTAIIGGYAKTAIGAAAGAVTAVALAPKITSVLSADVPTHTDTSAAVLSQMKTTSAMHHHDMSHTSADMAKHAGNHSANANPSGQKLSPGEVQRRGWRDMFSSNQPNTQPLSPGQQPSGWSHKFTPAQNAASMASAAPRAAASTHAPRDHNFAKQLDADRANLRDILNEGGRT